MKSIRQLFLLLKTWFVRGDRAIDRWMILFYLAVRKLGNVLLRCFTKKDSSFPWFFLFRIRIRGPGFRMECRKFQPDDLMIVNQMDYQQYFELPLGSVFVDVGANIGLFSLLTAGRSKAAVYAIEPVSRNLEQLKKNIALNGFTTIRVIPLALWNKKIDALPLFLDQNLSMSSAKKELSQKIFVPADTLDNVVKIFKIPKITLLKIDVEGAEKEVLEGAKNTLEHHRPNVIFEAWDKDIFTINASFLTPLGYTITHINQINFFARSPVFKTPLCA